jgi:hypothetical protein
MVHRVQWVLACLIAVIICPPALPALEYGLNCGAPILAATGAITGSTNPDVMKATGAGWVRVNFILGPWSAPTDATPRGPENLTWFQTYDRIVDGYVSRGVRVYGLIGAESVADARRERLNTEEFTADLTANAVQIIGHYLGRVQVYEIFNEPNDWAGGTSAAVEPRWLARYMESVYSAVKMAEGRATDPAWQAITLVTGPLFTHDLDLGGPYLTQVFNAGTQQWNWTAIRQQTGNYPFDGVGIHIYIAQGYEADSEVTRLCKRNLDSVYSALTALEGTQTPKKMFLTEFGWNSFYTNEQVQAQKMDVAFDLLKADTRIAQAHWFTLTDWGDNKWGIYRAEPYIVENRKPAYDVFYRHATSGPPRDEATFTNAQIPVWFEPGTAAGVQLTVRNIGTTTWKAIEGQDHPYALVAGSKSGGMSHDNAFSWSDFSAGGESTSPTAQTAWLAGDVAPGAEATFSFQARAPELFPRGPKPFAAAMRSPSGAFPYPFLTQPLVVFRAESLVNNGDFEEEAILTSWTTYGQVDGVISGSWFAGITASHGSRFVGSAANFGQKNGGLYQQIQVVPGGLYGVVAQVRTHREGGSAGDVACRIGLDPTGAVNPAAATVQWSSWTESQGQWTRIAARAEAAASAMTLFLDARQNAPVWNITAFDDVILGGPSSAKNRMILIH